MIIYIIIKKNYTACLLYEKYVLPVRIEKFIIKEIRWSIISKLRDITEACHLLISQCSCFVRSKTKMRQPAIRDLRVPSKKCCRAQVSLMTLISSISDMFILHCHARFTLPVTECGMFHFIVLQTLLPAWSNPS